MKARLALPLLLVMSVAGSLSAVAEPTLDAFRGVASGEGRFKSALIGLDRGFTVTTIGRQSGAVFVLDQQFRFDNGEIDRRVWRFRRIAPGRYAGTRKDVVGEAVVKVDGGRITMAYDVVVPRKDGSRLTLHFEDSVSRQGPRTVLNKAVIYTLGIPVGSVEAKLVRR
ncbi:DUF3833 domain-containing protein [Kaistia algarum]|uniref:DUF3833 family protein n=1 Tax=Kaistia algarum TaxID=2083279 RepID=UPI000CE8FBEF|nr:DUF3833 family protein [Kaistia algarum]MCX5513653.1 DUF3833 family protein [Kaistia algarum]PPE79468.1 DUF3833 domain-containing protein [Kaistia algarum]